MKAQSNHCRNRISSLSHKGLKITHSRTIQPNHKSHQSTTLNKKTCSNTKMTLLHQTISPFSLQSSQFESPSKNNQQNIYHKKQIELINSQYANLCHQATYQNPKLPIHQQNDYPKIMGRNQRDKLKCQKMININKKILQQIEEWKNFEHNWSLLTDFIDQFEVDNDIQDINTPIDLIKCYQDLKIKVQELEKEHEILFAKNIDNLCKVQTPKKMQSAQPQNKHYLLEKAFKRLQKKLSKQMSHVKFYEQKCKEYEKKLGQTLKDIYNIEQANHMVDMKIIDQKGKKQKAERKKKRKQLKSFQNSHKK